jgi:CubicO group peptidase (beta-lactamase class C family)
MGERVREIIAGAVATRAFPAAVAEVGTGTQMVWREAFGALTYASDSPRVTTDTLFDLASLTKVLATALCVMRAVDTGSVRLCDAVAGFLPSWSATDRRAVTVEDLLAHCAGLPAYLPLFQTLRGTKAIVDATVSATLAYPPRTSSVYSDLGFILLGAVLVRARGQELDTQFRAVVQALGLGDTLLFRPARRMGKAIAPTEHDPWRGRLLVGEVHDENAWALGGIAGHSGLFGTAEAVGVVARELLQILSGRRGIVSGATVLRFVTRRTGVPGSSRALGWDTMLPTSSCGVRMSDRAFGHTGYTGTSLWLDPEANRYAVLLTNRVHPNRSNDAITQVRQAFHDAIWTES